MLSSIQMLRPCVPTIEIVVARVNQDVVHAARSACSCSAMSRLAPPSIEMCMSALVAEEEQPRRSADAHAAGARECRPAGRPRAAATSGRNRRSRTRTAVVVVVVAVECDVHAAGRVAGRQRRCSRRCSPAARDPSP